MQVYDRLNRIGIGLSYSRVQAATSRVGDQFITELVGALQADKYIRFIGDNLNFKCDMSEERQDHHSHMVHMFASAALISDKVSEDLDDNPMIPLEDLSLQDIQLSRAEYQVIRTDCVEIVATIIGDFFPHLRFMGDEMRSGQRAPPRENHVKTKVVPLEVLPLNEMYYQDDVEILLYYEKLVRKMHQQAGIPLTANHQYQIGGDQLTRERFSKARFMRLRNAFEEERIDHLSPVTFEFFHLLMNVLHKVIYRQLYHEDSAVDPGTLRHAQERLHRRNLDPSDLKMYEANKDLFTSFFRAYMVQGVMSFFGMDSLEAMPTKNVPPAFPDPDTRKEWIVRTLGTFIDEFIFPAWTGRGGIQLDLVGEYL